VLVDQRVNEGAAIEAISYQPPEPDSEHWDSGFCLFAGPNPARTEVVCLDCALGDFKGIGAGLDVARKHGLALRDGDGWAPA
jgi:hypothetical protein